MLLPARTARHLAPCTRPPSPQAHDGRFLRGAEKRQRRRRARTLHGGGRECARVLPTRGPAPSGAAEAWAGCARLVHALPRPGGGQDGGRGRLHARHRHHRHVPAVGGGAARGGAKHGGARDDPRVRRRARAPRLDQPRPPCLHRDPRRQPLGRLLLLARGEPRKRLAAARRKGGRAVRATARADLGRHEPGVHVGACSGGGGGSGDEALLRRHGAL
mmetsp:Transcript_8971/g.26113  ORF Transcript_8971/g.26113 Transcript_8971/m.26113 type:complete len:217 (-) Transcript_8971:149-799(-)